MRTLVILLTTLALTTISFAQCTGQFQAGQACINPSNSRGPPTGGTTFPALMEFSLGTYLDNIYTVTGAPFINGSASVSGSPNLVLSNVFGGTNQGPGLSFNSLNSFPSSITSHYVNCGFSVITAGSELAICDEGYRAPSSVIKVITTSINSASAGCILCTGNDDNFWNMGTGTGPVAYKSVWTHILGVIGAAPTVGAGQIAYGGTTVAAGSGTCPTGTVGGQTIQGCIVINVAGTSRNLPFF